MLCAVATQVRGEVDGQRRLFFVIFFFFGTCICLVAIFWLDRPPRNLCFRSRVAVSGASQPGRELYLCCVWSGAYARVAGSVIDAAAFTPGVNVPFIFLRGAKKGLLATVRPRAWPGSLPSPTRACQLANFPLSPSLAPLQNEYLSGQDGQAQVARAEHEAVEEEGTAAQLMMFLIVLRFAVNGGGG